MRLQLEWQHPITLSLDSAEKMIYSFDYSKAPESAGIYLFGRRFNNQFEALYVGKAGHLRRRTKGQMNNVRLMNHLKSAKSGKRILLTAKFVAGKAQQEAKCLTILERALIRYFLSEGHDLVNKQGTRLWRHEIASHGAKRAVPKMMKAE